MVRYEELDFPVLCFFFKAGFLGAPKGVAASLDPPLFPDSWTFGGAPGPIC
jgi:hypothetical protein